MKRIYSKGFNIPVTLMIMRIYPKTQIPVCLCKSRKIGKAVKPIQAIVSVSHTVKFSRASIGQLLSSLLKSSEKEFTLIQSTTYCIVWRRTLPPPAYPEWLESEKVMGALPAAMDWPPGAGAFCRIHSKGGKTFISWERRKREGWWGASLCTHTLWTIGFWKNRLSRDKVQSSESNIPSDHVGNHTFKCKVGQCQSVWTLVGDKPEICLWLCTYNNHKLQYNRHY